RLGGFAHALTEVADDLAVPALEEEHHLTEMLVVRRPVDGEHARSEAAFDVVLDARTAPVTEHVVATGTEREDLADRVERVAHGRRARERTEVAASVLHDPARDEDAWPRVLHRHLHAHVALVVLETDVVA